MSRSDGWRQRTEGYRCPVEIFLWAHCYHAIRFQRRKRRKKGR